MTPDEQRKVVERRLARIYGSSWRKVRPDLADAVAAAYPKTGAAPAADQARPMDARKAQAVLRKREAAAEKRLARIYGSAWRKIRPDIADAVQSAWSDLEAAGAARGHEVIARAGRAVEKVALRELTPMADEAHAITTARAIENHALGQTQTAEMVAAKRGISLSQAQRELQALTPPRTELIAELKTKLPKAVARDLADRVTVGLALRREPAVILADVEAGAARGLNRALSWPRTEAMRSYRDASLEVMQRNGRYLQGWVWHSAQDRTTCTACWAMEGTVHPVDEPMDAHVSCRCIPIPLGVGEGAPATGEDLFGGLPEDEQRDILGPERLKLYRDGTPLSEMTKTHTHETWGSSITTAPIHEIKRRRAA